MDADGTTDRGGQPLRSATSGFLGIGSAVRVRCRRLFPLAPIPSMAARAMGLRPGRPRQRLLGVRSLISIAHPLIIAYANAVQYQCAPNITARTPRSKT